MQERKDVLGQRAVGPVNSNFGGNPQRKRPPQKQSLPLYYTMFLVVVTATITWTLSSYVNKIHSSSSNDNVPIVADRWLHPTANTAVKRKELPTSTAVEGKSKPVLELPKGHIDYSDYTGPSTIYTKFEHPFPCFKGEKPLMLQTPAHEGILFHRPMKTGSTTMTGIVLRLVHNRGQKHGFEKCKHRTMHGTGQQFDFVHRDKTKSFLFSMIREPQARALSQVFHFDVSVGMNEPTDEFVKSRLFQTYNYLHYYDDLNLRNYKNASNFHKKTVSQNPATSLGDNDVKEQENTLNRSPQEKKRDIERLAKQSRKYGPNFERHKLISDMLEDYDLVAIMERMDESLVALQMLLNLTTKEIVYTRARSSGSFSNGHAERPCMYILPAFISPTMKVFLESDEWQRIIAADVEFYKAAHKSLDRTIEALGRQEFDKKMAIFKDALKLAAKNCEGRIRTMCSSGGERIRPVNTTCYFYAEGCDHDCIDEMEL